MNEDDLTPMHRHVLLSIRREPPMSAAVLKSDLRTMARAGVDMSGLDENLVLRTLDELERLQLVKKEAGGYAAVYREPPKPKIAQRELF